MDIFDIRKLYETLPQAKVLLNYIESETKKSVFIKGLIASSAPIFFSSLAEKIDKTVVFILNDNEEAGYFYNDLKTILKADKTKNNIAEVLFFPSSYRRAIKYGQRDAGNEILRTETLTHLASFNEQKTKSPLPLYIVTYPEAISELVISTCKLNSKIKTVRVGEEIDLTELVKSLRSYGFKQRDYVYEPGHFALRGSIIDVYSYACELPYRIDFFDNEIDSIRTFNVETQLSEDKLDQIDIVPELSTNSEGKESFLKFLPKDTIIAIKDLNYVRDKIDKIYDEGFTEQAISEQIEGKTEAERASIRERLKAQLMFLTPYVFIREITAFKRIEFGNKSFSDNVSSSLIKLDISPQPLFHKNFDLLIKTLSDYQLQGYKLYILADSEKQIQRLKDIFDSETNKKSTDINTINFIPVNRTIHEGYIDNNICACLFTDHQIFDRFHRYNLKSDKARQGKMAITMKELQELEPGDYLVHIDYGIGKFAGLVRVPTGNSYQEMIRIVYQHNDIVDVSIHSLYKISKYKSSESGDMPKLSILGSGAWERLKDRAKKRIKDIARDLIKLYAKRRNEKGFAFSPDSYIQHELEASFIYEDTPDQLKTTQEVKQDMESTKPMDRLICGDVGFGKTEIAIRASLKAAVDGKQVAVLVPTTVLAFQHYQTFYRRLKDMPVTVEYLSRARTAKQTREILQKLEAGEINILIGTHKLLSKSVKWNDIGLLIIDEEQKFGVSTKEKLRKLKTNIDTLSMSATPIPRTLQFSLMGARDMSIIRTPPPNRYPIQTQISTFNTEIIVEAINFEMSRNGQIFFVNNRISSLIELSNFIKKHIPDCRIGIGHGQMRPEELEKIVMGFMNYEYDVLLSTTIVENGIDVSNANTIIINDAHKFGLSDLHQMRGRVGRSNKKAFCYLIAPPLTALNTDSRRRLEALETFSDLGSGFNIAVQDLDIRGAGNLLGAEQSGFMEDLGYETYQKILNQAVTELKNEEFHELYEENKIAGKEFAAKDFVEDCNIESDLEMYFPETFVPGSSERILLYRELDNIETDEQLKAYRMRLEDRFGKIPKQGLELMQIVPLRRAAKNLGCEKVILKGGELKLQFVSNVNSPYYESKEFGKILSYLTAQVHTCKLNEKNGKRYMVIKNVTSVGKAVNLLQEIEKS